MVIYSNSFLEFISNSRCKIARTLYRAYANKYPSYRYMLTTNEINYLALREDGSISFLPSGKEQQVTATGSWRKEGRQAGRPAKVIRKLFTEKALGIFKDKDFEAFANCYKTEHAGRFSFELLDRGRIPSVYDMDRAEGDTGLNQSCMNDKGYMMAIYTHCDALRILILTDESGLLCGRSLVWNLPGDIILMDRIYVVDDFMYNLFIDYAEEHRWWYKQKYNSADGKSDFINDKGKEVDERFTIYTATDFREFPYIDTFCYGGDGFLCNYKHSSYRYDETDGTRSGSVWDEIDKCQIDAEDAVTILHGSQAGAVTHGDNAVWVGRSYWWILDPEIIQIDDGYYHIDDTVRSEFDDRTYLKVDCVWSEYHDSFILIDDAVTRDGETYHVAALPEFQ